MKALPFALTLGLLVALPVPALAQAKTVLTVTTWAGNDATFKAVLPGWLKTHPNVEVRFVAHLGFNDYNVNLANKLSSGGLREDLVEIGIDQIAQYAEGRGFTDLSKAPYNAMRFQGLFLRNTFPQAISSDRRLIALPADIGTGTMFYRQDVLNKTGVKIADLTKSWESFIEAGKKIKAADKNIYLVADAFDVYSILNRTDIKPGEGVYFDKNGNVIVDNARWKRAFRLTKAIRTAGLDARARSWSPEWYESFKRGTVVSVFNGAWFSGALKGAAPETAGKWRVADLPGRSYASWGGAFWAIPEGSQNKALAWDLMQYFTLNARTQAQIFGATGNYPALLTATREAVFNQGDPFFGGQKVRQVWRASASKIPAIPVNKNDPLAQEIVGQALTQVLEQNKDIDAALADAKALIQRRVNR